MKRKQLRHRITIQAKQTVFDQYGDEITDYVDYLVNVPADVQYLSAREQIEAQQLQSTMQARIVIRYRSDELDTTMRIVYKSNVYDITGIIPDNETGRNHLTITVTTGLKDNG